jgi:hypothetical protein
MPLSMQDENSATQVFAAGGSGSFEFGASTPSSSSCQCTMDGFGINNGSNMGDGTVGPGANNRTTGSLSAFGPGATSTVSTGKSTYALVANDNPFNGAVSQSSFVYMKSQVVGTITFQNYDTLFSWGTNYSFL